MNKIWWIYLIKFDFYWIKTKGTLKGNFERPNGPLDLIWKFWKNSHLKSMYSNHIEPNLIALSHHTSRLIEKQSNRYSRLQHLNFAIIYSEIIELNYAVEKRPNGRKLNRPFSIGPPPPTSPLSFTTRRRCCSP